MFSQCSECERLFKNKRVMEFHRQQVHDGDTDD
jgi:hypothetical protein